MSITKQTKMPYASVSQGCVQAQGGGGQQRWIGLASKLEYYCCSSYYVTHRIECDIMQNPVVIIMNNHFLLQYKQTTLGCCSFIILFINTSVVHNIAKNWIAAIDLNQTQISCLRFKRAGSKMLWAPNYIFNLLCALNSFSQ